MYIGYYSYSDRYLGGLSRNETLVVVGCGGRCDVARRDVADLQRKNNKPFEVEKIVEGKSEVIVHLGGQTEDRNHFGLQNWILVCPSP